MSRTVADALNDFLRSHRLDRNGYRDRCFVVRVGPIRIPFPNPGRLPFHDLHHVALDVPPTFWGEVEISVFELRSGSPSVLITLLCIGAVFLGALLAPRRVLAWWRKFADARNLYREPSYEALLVLDVEELRARVGGVPICDRRALAREGGAS
jgi:hypothetical protein